MHKDTYEMLQNEIKKGSNLTDIVVNQAYKFDKEDYALIVKELIYTLSEETKQNTTEAMDYIKEYHVDFDTDELDEIF